MPKWVDNCVKKLLESNKEMSIDMAWAICYKQYNEKVEKQNNVVNNVESNRENNNGKHQYKL